MLNFVLTKIKKLIKILYSKPTGENPKPVRLKGNTKAYARYLYREHFWRWIRFSTIGFVMMGVSFLILFCVVSEAGLKPVFGYLVENAIMLQIGFLLNRRLTFQDRQTHWFKALLKWYTVRAGMFGAGQAYFFLLVTLFGFEYMVASLTIGMTLGFLNYSLSNFFAFSGRLKPTFATAQNS